MSHQSLFVASASLLILTTLGSPAAHGQLGKKLVPYHYNAPGDDRVIDGPGLRAGAVAFSPDGSNLVVGYYDGTVHRYDTRTGDSLGPPIQPMTSAIHALAILPNGDGLAVAGYKNLSTPPQDVVAIRRRGATEFDEIAQIPGPVVTLAYAADGKTIGAIDQIYNIRVWNVEDHQEVARSDDEPVSHQRWPDSPGSLASFSADLKRAVIVNRKQAAIDQAPIVNKRQAAFDQAPFNHLTRFWEAGSQGQRIFGFPTSPPVTAATISRDGSRTVIATIDDHLSVIDFISGEALVSHWAVQNPRSDEHQFLHFAADNRTLLRGAKEGVVILENMQDRMSAEEVFWGPSGYIRAAAWTAKGARLASGGWERLGNEKLAGTRNPKYEPVILWEVEVENAKNWPAAAGP